MKIAATREALPRAINNATMTFPAPGKGIADTATVTTVRTARATNTLMYDRQDRQGDEHFDVRPNVLADIRV